MAPSMVDTSVEPIMVDVLLEGIRVRALVDSGATASCCTEQWFRKNQQVLGTPIGDGTKVKGIENVPIAVRGRTKVLPLTWSGASTPCSLLIVPTLVEPDLILGMDVMDALGVKIDIRRREAIPTDPKRDVLIISTLKIPPRSSLVVDIDNPLVGEELLVFEPGEKLHQQLMCTPTLVDGRKKNYPLGLRTSEKKRSYWTPGGPLDMWREHKSLRQT